MLHVDPTTACIGDVGRSGLAVVWAFGFLACFFHVPFAQIIYKKYILCCLWLVLHTFRRERFALSPKAEVSFPLSGN